MKKHWVKKILSDKRAYPVILALVFFSTGFGVYWFLRPLSPGMHTTKTQVAEAAPEFRDPLTGLPHKSVLAYQDIFGVMIDGHEDAQPVSGIDQAFLVIEAPVEAGIPRQLAFFTKDAAVHQIGPVRSARPYFIDWANELDALYVHVGGSNAALEKIANGITFDLNQFWHDDQFWRDARQFAPHNLYTSPEQLQAYVDAKRAAGRVSDPVYGVWAFLETEPTTGGDVTRIPVSFGEPSYAFEWVFDAEKKVYVRTQEGKKVLTREGEMIFAHNVVIMKTDIDVIDHVGRRKIKTIGKGKVRVYQFGNVIEGTWVKERETDRVRFFNAQGSEIKMAPGKTWIEVSESRVL